MQNWDQKKLLRVGEKTFKEWRGLIEEAEAWNYDKEMGQQEKAIAFIQFVIWNVIGANL